MEEDFGWERRQGKTYSPSVLSKEDKCNADAEYTNSRSVLAALLFNRVLSSLKRAELSQDIDVAALVIVSFVSGWNHGVF